MCWNWHVVACSYMKHKYPHLDKFIYSNEINADTVEMPSTNVQEHLYGINKSMYTRHNNTQQNSLTVWYQVVAPGFMTSSND